jgi:hypothetical protein
LDKYPYNYANEETVVLYSSINVAKRVKRDRKGWAPWFDDKSMKCSTYYSHWGERMVNQHYGLYPLGEVLRCPEYFYGVYGNSRSGLNKNLIPVTDRAIFVRPDSNNKQFFGSPVFRSEFRRWKQHIEDMELDCPKDLLVLVAQPETILNEYRCLMYHNVYMTGSLYMVQHQYQTGKVPDNIIEYANTVKGFEGLPNPYILDLAETSEGIKILEIGSVHCCGLYGMDLDIFTQTLTKAAEQ